MPDDNAKARTDYSSIHDEWRSANDAARAARGLVTWAYDQALRGEGLGPTVWQIERAESLEYQADMIASEMNFLVARHGFR